MDFSHLANISNAISFNHVQFSLMSQMRSTVEDVHSAPLSRGKKVAVAIKGITDFF